MNYECIEEDIAKKLNSSRALCKIATVMVLPDSVSDFKSPQTKGVVTVVFNGEKYARNQSIGDVSQHYTLSFTVAIQARRLRGPAGIYAIAELVKGLLLGFRPENCGTMMLSEHSLAALHEATEIWEHHIVFSCSSLRVSNEPNTVPNDDITDGDIVFYDPEKLTINNCNS